MLVGIGNPLRGDDGLGPALIQMLQGHVRALCLDVGTTPESYIGKIIKEKPDTIVLVDAVHLGVAPGRYAVLEKDEIAQAGFSTHDCSPKILLQYLESQVPSNIYLLGVQPGTLAMGHEISNAVSAALNEIAELMKEILNA